MLSRTFDPVVAERCGHDCTCLNLRKAARLVTQRYDDALRPAGILATQFSLLTVSLSHAPATIHDLAEVLAVDRTTLTRNLRPLQRDGLVRQTRGDDRRTRHISVTPKGRRVLERAYPLWSAAQADMMKQIGREPVGRLNREFVAMVEALIMARTLRT